MTVAHTCYCFNCGLKLKEALKELRAQRNRIEHLELQIKISNNLLKNKKDPN